MHNKANAQSVTNLIYKHHAKHRFWVGDGASRKYGEKMKIRELRYSNTNTYLIEGERGKLLVDTGWAGTFPLFCKALGEMHVSAQEISAILISHFHPDHMGIAQEIADQGAVILIPELQKPFLHAADAIFAKESKKDGGCEPFEPERGGDCKGFETQRGGSHKGFEPLRDEACRVFPLAESRAVLKEFGIDGELFHTPGHSDDSISLWLDDGALFVGDLNPLYELELHQGTEIGKSWEKLLKLGPKIVYYGHAPKAVLGGETAPGGETKTASGSKAEALSGSEKYALVERIMKLIDKGADIKKIQKKTHADEKFIENVMRMYLTHQNISVQGILDRIELRAMH